VSTSEFETELERRLEVIRGQGLYRELHPVDSAPGPTLQREGRTLLNFSSNDYLGLANEPLLKEAACRAVQRYGAGAGASRLICGSLAPHHELEETLAAFKGTEAALSFSSGYATALGTICALLDKQSIIVLDKLVHACIVDAARQSGAKIRVFAHNDLNDLERILRWTADFRSSRIKVQGSGFSAPGSPGRLRVLVVTESVFSMDGDHAPLGELVRLKEKYGAWLMVDEAHATGLYGLNRRGLAEETSTASQIEVQMGTLGKAIGAAGGYIAGPRVLIDYLINRARSFVFSTAPVPAAAAAATAGIRFVQSEAGEARQRLLWERVDQVRIEARAEPLPGTRGDRSEPTAAPLRASAILPIMIGEEAKAVEAARRLQESGVFVPAIRYPTVARGAARLRLTVTARHSALDIRRLTQALADAGLGVGVGISSRPPA
jgi:8-amino-7-oxononanoate synthase